MAKVKTPTLDKIQENATESQIIGNFLDWLDAKHLEIAGYQRFEGKRDSQLVPLNKSVEEILADYFEIDLKAAENERRAVIAAHKKATKQRGDIHHEGK